MFIVTEYAALRRSTRNRDPSKHIKAGYNRSTSETPLKWRFAGGLMVVLECMLAGGRLYVEAQAKPRVVGVLVSVVILFFKFYTLNILI